MVRHAIMCSDYPRRQSLGVATSRYCAPHGRPEIAMELPQPAVPDNARYWSIMRTAVAPSPALRARPLAGAQAPRGHDDLGGQSLPSCPCYTRVEEPEHELCKPDAGELPRLCH